MYDINSVVVVGYPRLNSARPSVTALVLSLANRYGRVTRGFWSGTPGQDCECSSEGAGTTQAFVLPPGLATRLVSLVQNTKRNERW